MLTVRAANVNDAELIRKLVMELADYEKQPAQVTTSEADIVRDGVSQHPEFRVLIAEWPGTPAGFALFLRHYSTWRGAGFYLEDLFVRTEFRGRGIGKALLAEIARAARQEKRLFIRWAVLDWNESAIAMYGKVGAEFLNEWRTVVLTGSNLTKLAEHSPSNACEALST